MNTTYSPFKIFRFPKKIDSLPRESSNIEAPIHVRIKPINACDHDCNYCAYRVSELKLGEQMNLKDVISLEKMTEIINDFKEMGVKSVTFSGGGEPLRYPHMVETLKLLISHGIKFGINTNGASLNGEVARLIANYATWVRISIDGWDGKSYGEYRNIGDDVFQKVLTNIKELRAMKPVGKIGANIIVDHKNATHLKSLTTSLKDSGVDNIKFSPCVISNDMLKNFQYHEPFMDQVQKSYEQCQNELSGEDFEIYNSFPTMAPTASNKKYQWCPSLQIIPVIGADLNIYSCQDKAYTEVGRVGSIVQQSFKVYWYNEKEKFFKINPSKDCPQHCVADNKNKMLVQHLSEHPDHQDFV